MQKHNEAYRFHSQVPVTDYGPEQMMESLEVIEKELALLRNYDEDVIEHRIARLELAVEILIGFTKSLVLK